MDSKNLKKNFIAVYCKYIKLWLQIIHEKEGYFSIGAYADINVLRTKKKVREDKTAAVLDVIYEIQWFYLYPCVFGIKESFDALKMNYWSKERYCVRFSSYPSTKGRISSRKSQFFFLYANLFCSLCSVCISRRNSCLHSVLAFIFTLELAPGLLWSNSQGFLCFFLKSCWILIERSLLRVLWINSCLHSRTKKATLFLITSIKSFYCCNYFL